MGGISHLNFREILGIWLLEGGMKTSDRLTRFVTDGYFLCYDTQSKMKRFYG